MRFGGSSGIVADVPAEDPIGSERERFHGNGHKTVRAEVQGFLLFRSELEIADVIRAETDDHCLVGDGVIAMGMGSAAI